MKQVKVRAVLIAFACFLSGRVASAQGAPHGAASVASKLARISQHILPSGRL